ncbi:MAG: hypothetical protein WBO55_11690 [Rhizobiaceae bacterium]
MVDEKSWYLSKTIWGSLISVAAALTATLGISIGADAQTAIADALVQMIAAAGSLYAIYGRLTATEIIS